MRSLAHEVQHVTGESVTLAFVDQEYAGQEGMQLHVITRKEAKKGVVLLLRRCVIERSFGLLALPSKRGELL